MFKKFNFLFFTYRILFKALFTFDGNHVIKIYCCHIIKRNVQKPCSCIFSNNNHSSLIFVCFFFVQWPFCNPMFQGYFFILLQNQLYFVIIFLICIFYFYKKIHISWRRKKCFSFIIKEPRLRLVDYKLCSFSLLIAFNISLLQKYSTIRHKMFLCFLINAIDWTKTFGSFLHRHWYSVEAGVLSSSLVCWPVSSPPLIHCGGRCSVIKSCLLTCLWSKVYSRPVSGVKFAKLVTLLITTPLKTATLPKPSRAMEKLCSTGFLIVDLFGFFFRKSITNQKHQLLCNQRLENESDD